MKELEMLLRQRWILKADQKEQYYRIRDNIGEVRKFASDKLGCQIIENSLLVKMEKVPVKPEEFMGVQEFSSKEEYAFLCTPSYVFGRQGCPRAVYSFTVDRVYRG